MEIIKSKLQGNLLQEFTADYLEKHKDLIDFVKKETEKQLSLGDVVGQSEQLQSFVSGFYEWHKKQNYLSVKREDWDEYIKTL